jgi:predicted RNase H-like HicB family nuclease
MITFLGAIHKDPGSSYGVSVPDLPGCISASDTFSEALSMAKEAIELYLTSMLDDAAAAGAYRGCRRATA